MAAEDSAPKTSVKAKPSKGPAEEQKKSKKEKKEKSRSKKDSESASKENAVEDNSGMKDSGAGKKEDKKSKKRRHDEEAEEAEEGDNANDDNKDDEQEQKRKKKMKKNKRVSFSADVKLRDGSDPSDEEMTAVNGEGDSAAVFEIGENDGDDEGEKTKNKKPKKEKKKKNKEKNLDAASSSTTATTHESPILGYLNLYAKNRPAWKFQKNRETHLFKHILSLEQVPANYNAALLVYLQGLKSEGAKLRLRQVAEEAVKADIEAAETEDKPDNVEEVEEEEEEGQKPTAEMSPYHDAVGAFRKALGKDLKEELDNLEVPDALDAETIKRLRQRQRGELVLFGVIGGLFNYQKPKPSAQKGTKNAAQNQPGKKKKKNRTAFIEISSSSESDGDSDSDSDDDKATSAAKAKGKKRDSSSDSTSDSDSDSS
ncbi:hypothetical protein FE257_005041 [Aspergillus nanangensis]|uniref:WKF domain-containing protein n=1 Tax=Aspergillus nanangensis TaxID=2582783 RepID=A0AAD4CR05_ASPNN|nr:hypothetical protein FE257_005041 [Aspergillus nanangensis]